MSTVKKLLKEKGSAVWSASSATPVFEALQIMADKDIGALLVIDAGRLVGIFSERDYARKVILKGKASRNTPLQEIMTSDVITVRPGASLEQCLAILGRQRIRYLPVVEDNKILGILSIGDILSAIISEQAATLSQYEDAGLNKDI